MTELERARAHLLYCQHTLHEVRQCAWLETDADERNVLAALAWVWQEQEREKAGKLINDYGIPWMIREALGAFP